MGAMSKVTCDRSMSIDAIGASSAYVMGRNMFDPVRGEWDEAWEGWWGR
jgi:dihydrofolate reductase